MEIQHAPPKIRPQDSETKVQVTVPGMPVMKKCLSGNNYFSVNGQSFLENLEWLSVLILVLSKECVRI